MKEYHKIESLFNRDERTFKFVEGAWRCPEFEYLALNTWIFTEKVNGTCMRVQWHSDVEHVKYRGKTDNAQIPSTIYEKLEEVLPTSKFQLLYPNTTICLYGEGYGAKIQKGGGNYIPDGVSFVLFDVKIGEWWLRREDVEDIASKLGIEAVPIVARGTVYDAIDLVKSRFNSTWGPFPAEGLVLRPEVELQNRGGKRIITKLKTRDFD